MIYPINLKMIAMEWWFLYHSFPERKHSAPGKSPGKHRDQTLEMKKEGESLLSSSLSFELFFTLYVFLIYFHTFSFSFPSGNFLWNISNAWHQESVLRCVQGRMDQAGQSGLHMTEENSFGGPGGRALFLEIWYWGLRWLGKLDTG